MSIVKHKELLDRLKRTFDLLRPGVAVSTPNRRADHLVRMNFAPTMGRRDAALDHAARLISSDIFMEGDEKWRARVFVSIAKLLSEAEADTRSLIGILSSPDTISRERAMLDLLVLARSIALTLCDFAALESGLLGDGKPSTLRELAAQPTESELARSEKTLSDSGIDLVHQLRVLFERARPKLARYREYSGKSFSESYAARYKCAFDAYTKIFDADYPVALGGGASEVI